MNLPDLIQINIPFIVILLLAALGALFSYSQYKKTLPEISAPWRWGLALLRGLMVFLLLLAFFRPQITAFYHKQKKKQLAVFIDRSQSMTVQDDSLPRWRQEQLAVQQIRRFAAKNLAVSWYGFHSDVFRMNPDSLQPTLYGTNLLKVVKKINRLTPDAAIIMSDGNYTEGSYPAAGQWNAGVPLFTVGLGQARAEPDLFIREVSYKPVAYQGKPQTIVARIGSIALHKAFKGRVYLKANGKTVNSAALLIRPREVLQQVDLHYTPQKAGPLRLQVFIEPLHNEKNTVNNHYTGLQNILKGRLKVAVISGAVDYDSKFIHQLLNARNDIDCDLFVQVKNNRWIGGKAPRPENFDVLVFSNFPGPYSTPANVQMFLNLIETQRCGLLFVTGKYVNQRYLKLFKEYLPFRMLPQHVSGLATLQISPQEDTGDPLLQVFDSKNRIRQFWEKVPPLEIFYMGGQLNKEANTLLTALTVKKRVPILIRQQFPKLRSIVLNGAGFWKWHFLLQDAPELSGGYGNLLHLSVRWLSERQKLQQVVLQSVEKTHYLGRPVHLNVRLFDAAFKPLRDGRVTIEASWNKQKFYLDAGTAADSNGVYHSSFIPPGEGRYTVTATGYRNNVLLGNDQLVFEVIPFEKELLETRQNIPLLREMASASGGRYVTVSGLDSLKEILNTTPQRIRVRKTLNLWDSIYLLMAILGLIFLEWTLRKFKGLA